MDNRNECSKEGHILKGSRDIGGQSWRFQAASPLVYKGRVAALTRSGSCAGSGALPRALIFTPVRDISALPLPPHMVFKSCPMCKS